MDFFEVISKRRSIRRFQERAVPPEMILRAFEAAILAPNSSNTQTWDFYWVQSSEIKSKLVQACFSQSAARTAQELIVVTANHRRWKRSQASLIQWALESKAPKGVVLYYERLIPFTYRAGFLNIFAPFKWIFAELAGLFRPVPRGPLTKRDLQEVAIKSAALACENLVLALTAQGLASCMMEGFDERRVRRLLKLSCSDRVVMVIGTGYEKEGQGTWGPQVRLPIEKVVHRV